MEQVRQSRNLRIVVIDNYDSFVYNLVQYIGRAGAEPIVFRNDKIDIAGIVQVAPDGILISPGPGRPEEAGISNDILRHLSRAIPTFGVCLGHQCLGSVFGGTVARAPHVMHGKTSQISHDGLGVFSGLTTPITATRYHSLVVVEEGLPPSLEITARSEDGLIMGLRHREYPIEGVQFHPESVLTEGGLRIVENFLDSVASKNKVSR